MTTQQGMPVLVILTILLSACQPAPSALSKAATVQPTEALTLFEDEFNDDALDREKWATEYLWGHTNPPELQYYSHDAFTIADGRLIIKAEHNETEDMHYVSGMISSHDSFTFTYGYIEARIKIPAGQGLWSAFWLLDAGGSADEIDIAEFLGHEPAITYMTLHYADEDGHEKGTADGKHEGTDFSSDFHTIGVDWQKETIAWYVDGVKQYEVTENIPSKPMYIIANLAIGGDWPGEPDSKTHFPATYEIDYIRLFQQYQP